MSNLRYHVHIIHTPNEQPIVNSQLALFFENRAFLTYDLPVLSSETTAYSRRCIDACDCVVIVTGDNYGETNASGVSQLHLSYLTAKTKQKPMLIFVKKSLEESSRRIADFAKLLETQNNSYLYHYQHEQVLRQHLNNVYDEFEKSFAPVEWVCQKPTSTTVNGALLNAFAPNSSTLESIKANIQNNRAQTPSTAVAFSTSPTLKSKSNERIGANKESKLLGDAYDIFADEHISIQKDRDLLSDNDDIVYHSPGHKLATSANDLMHIDNIKVLLEDELVINYRAHAYEEGNLTDVSLSKQLKWKDIVSALIRLGSRFSTESIYRCLNGVVALSASDTVRETMPDVHAVSRCQVSQIDFVWIHSQLRHNGWLEAIPTKNTERNSNNRNFWQLTSRIKEELNFLNE